MIRLVYAIRRQPHLSLAQFHDHWRNIHGPLVVKNAEALGVSRYVQVHTLEDPNNAASREARGMLPPYDGVSELWWDDRAAAEVAANTPAGESATQELLEGEKGFVDFSRSSLWLAIDLPQVNPTPEDIVASEDSSVIKFYYVLNRLQHLSREQFQLYWRMNHGPLIRSLAPQMQVLRYIQVHTIEDPMTTPQRTARGTMEGIYDGHAELWFDTAGRSDADSATERQRASTLAAEDEAKFIDFTRSTLWVGKEHVLLERA